MKILVTGGAGFIGSHVADRYISEGHRVAVVDNLSSGSLSNVNPKARFYLMDIRSNDLEKVFEIERPDVVNHHAAQISIPASVEDPLLDADINVMGFIRLLNLCVEYRVKKIIFISSGGALCGDADKIPTDEDYEPLMISPYAINKYLSEKYLHFYQVTHGLKYTVLRYANVYGPRQIAKGECGAVPIFMENLIKGRPSRLFAYGDMPKGTIRDYVFVGDVCRANLLALDRGDNRSYNIGSGEGIYIEDLYHLMEEVAGKRLPLERCGERIGDVRRSVLDISRARKELGWEPETDLRRGLEITFQYCLKREAE